MNEYNILDSDENSDIDAFLKAKRKKLIKIIGALIVFNIFMTPFFIKNGRNYLENLITSAIAYLISFNILGLILGSIFAILPYKGLGYSKKYLRASLLTILTLHILFAVASILLVLMSLSGMRMTSY